MSRYGIFSLFVILVCFFMVNGQQESSDECQRMPARPPPFQNNKFKTCCEIPLLLNPTMDVMMKCHQQVMSLLPPPPPAARQPPPRGPPPHFSVEMMTCKMECLFNSSGYLSTDGNVKEDVLKEKFGEILRADEKWSPVADDILKTCISSSDATAESNNSPCKMVPYQISKCLGRELLLNCPKEIWDDTPECAATKEHLLKCPNLSFPLLPMFPKPRRH